MDEHPKRRHQVAHLGIPELAHLIDLPEGARIHHVVPRSNPDGVDVVIESAAFDEVEHYAEAPRALSMRRWVMTDDEGRTWSRWAVE